MFFNKTLFTPNEPKVNNFESEQDIRTSFINSIRAKYRIDDRLTQYSTDGHLWSKTIDESAQIHILIGTFSVKSAFYPTDYTFVISNLDGNTVYQQIDPYKTHHYANNQILLVTVMDSETNNKLIEDFNLNKPKGTKFIVEG